MTNISPTTCEVKQVKSIKIQSYSYIYGVGEFVTKQENYVKTLEFTYGTLGLKTNY
jgi:hypothetical protein